MKLIKAVVDKKPKSCVGCPLSRELQKDCGTPKPNKINGGLTWDKVPNVKCKLTVVNKE